MKCVCAWGMHVREPVCTRSVCGTVGMCQGASLWVDRWVLRTEHRAPLVRCGETVAPLDPVRGGPTGELRGLLLCVPSLGPWEDPAFMCVQRIVRVGFKAVRRTAPAQDRLPEGHRPTPVVLTARAGPRLGVPLSGHGAAGSTRLPGTFPALCCPGSALPGCRSRQSLGERQRPECLESSVTAAQGGPVSSVQVVPL